MSENKSENKSETESETENQSLGTDSFWARFENERKESKTRSSLLKERVLKELKRIGASTATIFYEGGGDSGCVENITVKDKDGKEMELTKDPVIMTVIRSSTFEGSKWVSKQEEKLVDLEAALEDLAYDALAGYHPGWEINEGAYGDLQIDVEKETATLMHSARITDVEYSEDEL